MLYQAGSSILYLFEFRPMALPLEVGHQEAVSSDSPARHLKLLADPQLCRNNLQLIDQLVGLETVILYVLSSMADAAAFLNCFESMFGRRCLCEKSLRRNECQYDI